MNRFQQRQQLLANAEERAETVAALVEDFNVLGDFIEGNKALSAIVKAEPELPISDLLIKYINDLEKQNADRHLVWLNTAGDGFSNSWTGLAKAGPLSLEGFTKEIEGNPDLKTFKLIEYRCLTDNGFRFNNLMKLR